MKSLNGEFLLKFYTFSLFLFLPVWVQFGCGSTALTYSSLVCDQVVWAVTDLTVVPKGSMLINPDTGTPYLNRKHTHTRDTSIYTHVTLLHIIYAM